MKPADVEVDNKFVGTVEQMYASRCFLGRRATISLVVFRAYDPHALPAPEGACRIFGIGVCNVTPKDLAAWREARLAKRPDDSCIVATCRPERHGSPYGDYRPHDTRQRARRAASTNAALWPRAVFAAVAIFHRRLAEVPDPEQTRNLAIALVEVARKQDRRGNIGQSLSNSLYRCWTEPSAGDPGDSDAWEARASAFMLLDRPEQRSAVQKPELYPERETTLYLAAALPTF